MWFEQCAFTSIATAVPITNRICALRGNILFLLQHAFLNCARTYHVPKELCVHTSSESGFLGGSRSKRPFLRFKSLIWKSFAFTKSKNRLSKQERVRILIRNGFRNVIRSFAHRPIVNRLEHNGGLCWIHLPHEESPCSSAVVQAAHWTTCRYPPDLPCLWCPGTSPPQTVARCLPSGPQSKLVGSGTPAHWQNQIKNQIKVCYVVLETMFSNLRSLSSTGTSKNASILISTWSNVFDRIWVPSKSA